MNKTPGRQVKEMKNIKMTMLCGLCMICLVAVIVPAAGALGNGTSWSDNPEHITAMKAYVAYADENYQAMMNGAISYIGTISGPAGTNDLTGAEQQFTATAASVQSMTTSESIEAARTRMKAEVATFRTDTANDLKAYNGSESALRTSVNASVTADQAAIESLDTAWWTARETSRLDEFTRNDATRNGVLANLSAKGVDVSQAKGIETQIDGLQGSLRSALDARDEKTLASTNAQLGMLCKQFGNAISGDAWQARETTRLAEFDKRTTFLANQLTNATARGTDVTQAKAALSQITTERDQLKAAFDNHDQQGVKTIDSRLITLYQQFRTSIQELRQSAVATARANAGNTTRNASFRPAAFRHAETPVVTGGNTS